MTFETNFKPSRTARKKAEKKKKTERKATERNEMMKVRKRDRVCRFPLCGCKKLGLPLEVAHLRHRGMGGNPKGDRTNTAEMILLCSHRHQFGGVSLHKGTLRVVAMTPAGCDGEVQFEVLRSAVEIPAGDYGDQSSEWVPLATESLGGLVTNQIRRGVLAELARMED